MSHEFQMVKHFYMWTLDGQLLCCGNTYSPILCIIECLDDHLDKYDKNFRNSINSK